MPRKNPLPSEELQIGERVRLFRERRALSRAAFARELGVDSSLVTNIELGRSPVRYDFSERLYKRFVVNRRWLATGEPPVVFRVNFYGYDARIPPQTLFSKAYAEHLARGTENALREEAEKSGCRIEELDSPLVSRLDWSQQYLAEETRGMESRLLSMTEQVLHSLPPSLYRVFWEAAMAFYEKFVDEHRSAILKHLRAKTASPKAKTSRKKVSK